MTYRFCNGKFPDGTLDATIGVDFREKIVRMPYYMVTGGGGGDKKKADVMRLQLWDTAGQERYRKSMIAHYYRNVSAVVLVYDIGRPETFDALAQWLEECRRYDVTPDNLPMIIVGNKLDGNVSESQMKVKTKIAQRWVRN